MKFALTLYAYFIQFISLPFKCYVTIDHFKWLHFVVVLVI
jgi:hypothetical protein